MKSIRSNRFDAHATPAIKLTAVRWLGPGDQRVTRCLLRFDTRGVAVGFTPANSTFGLSAVPACSPPPGEGAPMGAVRLRRARVSVCDRGQSRRMATARSLVFSSTLRRRHRLASGPRAARTPALGKTSPRRHRATSRRSSLSVAGRHLPLDADRGAELPRDDCSNANRRSSRPPAARCVRDILRRGMSARSRTRHAPWP